MTFSLGVVGAGQFSGRFAALFHAHPGVGAVHVTDLLPECARRLAAAEGLGGTFPSYEAMLESDTVEGEPRPATAPGDPALRDVAPGPRAAFTSGCAPVHDRSRLPREFDGLHDGHEGSRHFLADDFVTAVSTGTLPPVNAWVAARYTLPGVVAHRSAPRDGVRPEIPDLGDAPGV